MKTTLLLMAAGMGSRYGGSKQTDGLGPHGEILMEYAVYDAIRAGFDRIVFIIKPDMVELMDSFCKGRIDARKTRTGENVEVEYVFQDFSSLPGSFSVPEGRTKPYGTAHAVLCAKDAVHEPFAVINADDFYGADAMRKMHGALVSLPSEGRAAMVAYTLGNTVSKNGSVSRGICSVRDGKLDAVTETYKITVRPDGTIFDDAEGGEVPLDPDALVSMNLWGFTPWIFGELEKYFRDFLSGLAPDEMKKECVLPGMVDSCIKSGRLDVSVLSTDSEWFGVTYREDRQFVSDSLKKMHALRRYPGSLWK
ncbi:MAG: hypothetical protein J5569_06005 [Oscillospiraceae bacterium]|nr:hypothetical protein [Oscillospiraceae bacterium]